MSKNIYGKKQGIPLSNKILLVASIVCVIAAVVVFIFFNKHQKNNNNDIVLSATPTANADGSDATPVPNGDPVVPSAATISGRFNPPAGYERVQIQNDSFAEYLRNFTLREYGVKPLTYDANTKTLVNDDAAPSASVLAMDLINKGNLQQSSDSMIRLYAE